MTTPQSPGMPGGSGTSTTDPWDTTSAGATEAQPDGGPKGSVDMKDETKDAAGKAADQARQTAGTAAGEGRHVAGVAKDEVRNVAHESKQQAENLLDEARSQIDEQSRTQRDRLVGTLRTFGDDIEKMANGEQAAGGMAQDLARQVAQRTRDLSSRIDGREPVELLGEVRSFARRRPGTFLLGALAAGVVAGRLTRGAKEAQSSGGSGTASGNGVYDDVRGAAYPAGSALDEPGTTMDQSLGTPGTPDAAPAADSSWTSGGRGTL